MFWDFWCVSGPGCAQPSPKKARREAHRESLGIVGVPITTQRTDALESPGPPSIIEVNPRELHGESRDTFLRQSIRQGLVRAGWLPSQ